MLLRNICLFVNLDENKLLTGEKNMYYVDITNVATSVSLHTTAVTRLLTDTYVVELVEYKRTNNQDYFMEDELKKLNDLFMETIKSYDPKWDDNIEFYDILLKGITEMSYNLDNNKYVFNTDFKQVIGKYTDAARDYTDPELGKLYSDMDSYMQDFIKILQTSDYESALAQFKIDTDNVIAGSYSTEDNAVMAAMLVGIGRSSVELYPEYSSAFGQYPTDPLTIPECGLATDADARMTGIAGGITMFLRPVVNIGAGILGGVVASSTITILNWIHHTHY